MDCIKIGSLISKLRKEKDLTQQNIADALNISNKTISKWECGLGCPDVSLWPELSVILGVDMGQLLEGEITCNRPDSGNISRIRFYVCPSCQNILTSTGSSSIFCCGRKLEPLALNKEHDAPAITTEIMDTDYYVVIDHPMRRDHYILFAAYINSDTVLLNRLYPEQNAAVRIPYLAGGTLYLYCSEHGLAAHSFNKKKRRF